MFGASLTKAQMQEIFDGMSELDFARYRYCQEMAGTYLAVGMFEQELVHAMHMCDRVKLQSALGSDERRWQQSLAKQEKLQGSTLGSLIKILVRHNISERDIRYLMWIKEKRDYFVHRLFHDGCWPGDLDEEMCRSMTRRLLAIQCWLSRAERNIWSIFERADFVELQRFDDGSVLVMNLGVLDLLDESSVEASDNRS